MQVEALGVEWRETNFLRTLGHRRRAFARRRAAAAASKAAGAGAAAQAARDDTAAGAAESSSGVWGVGGLFGRGGAWDVARVALLDGAVAVTQSSSDPGRDRRSSSSSSGGGGELVVPGDVHAGPGGWFVRRVRRAACLGHGLWPLLVDDPTVSHAPLLLLRLPALDGLSPNHFQGAPSPLGAPPWLAEVYAKLRWCDAERKGGMFKPKSAGVAMSADDCYGLGKEGTWT
jgi:hypothetical protein